MTKKLLYLEDTGSLLRQTLHFLEEDGYEVIPFSRIDMAKEFIKKNPDGGGIDCIITDLNMNDEWLEEFRGESMGGLLSGWVWLRHFVFVNPQYLKIPCIIYSGYIPELETYLRERNERNLIKQYHVSRVKKGGNNNNGYGMLIEELEKVLST